MEYTKDIILDVRYKGRIKLNKINTLLSNIKKYVTDNKFVFIILTSLIILTLMDIILVNSFLNILVNLY